MKEVEEATDAALVHRVLAGDIQAYAGLVKRYRDRLGRYAVRMLGNHADAEEAVQDAFVRAYRSLANCTDPDGFGAWLFKILVNRCRTIGSQRARRERTIVSNEAAIDRTGVPDSAERNAWRDAIEWAVAQLGPAYREAFVLKYVEELSYEEMAELTGCTVSALKMRVHRAREELRVALTEMERA